MKYLFLNLLFFSSMAQACVVGTQLKDEDLQKADLIFIGRVQSLQFFKDSPAGNAVLKFEVEKVLKGKPSGKIIEALLTWGTGGSPSDLTEFRKWYGSKHRVGVIAPETIKKNMSCKMTDVTWGDGRKSKEMRCNWISRLPVPFFPSDKMTYDRPWVVKEPCSNAFILNEDSKQSL